MDYDFSSFPMTRISTRYSSRKFPLHALTVLLGHSKETSPSYYNDGKSMELSSYSVWQYTIAGRGRLDINGTSRDLLPGSLMIVSVPGPQMYCLPEDSPSWEFVFLVLIGREAVRITRMIEQHIGQITGAEAIPKTIALLHETMQKIYSGEIQDPFVNSEYTYRLCMTFLEEASALKQVQEKHTFDDLKKFLIKNLIKNISVEEMAKEMHLSRSHFTRTFSKEIGMSPRKYFEDLRLKTSMDILFKERASIKEAAAQCGINDVNYFCRIFKKRYGISPGKYRKKKVL